MALYTYEKQIVIFVSQILHNMHLIQYTTQCLVCVELHELRTLKLVIQIFIYYHFPSNFNHRISWCEFYGVVRQGAQLNLVSLKVNMEMK
jgi:hypothetical protein